MDKNQIGESNWLPVAPGCLLFAAIFAAGCAIFLSCRTRCLERKRGRFPFNSWLNVLAGIVFFFGLVAVFYTVEDWRGHRAWEQCKRGLEAGGAVLDWSKYMQPPVPDEQNFFKAPKMAEWFGIYRESPNPADDVFRGWWQSKRPQVKLADVVVLPLFSNTNSGDADEVLNYDSPDPALFKVSTNNFRQLQFPVQFADVPLTTAIESLARLAGIQYVLDPKVSRIWHGTNQPIITARWEKSTPADLLFIMIDNHGLQLVPNPKTGVALVTVKASPYTPRIHLSPEESDRMKKMLQKVIGTNANDSYDRPLLATSLSEIKPARIVLRSERTPSDEEIADLFRQSYPNEQKPVASVISLKHTALDRVEVMLTADSAASSLEWCNQSEPDFELLRQALKRPYAQRDSDYVDLPKMKLPNFITVREMAQLLGTGATCHLLLNQPDEALSDLTLLNDTRRILEARPMTLVSAMMNVAVCGIYTEQIKLGLRWGVWKQPQLVALQKQLETIKLLPDIASGLRTQQAICGTFAPADYPPDYLLVGRRSLWQKLRYPGFWMFDIAPRGWLDQNRAVAATIYEKQIRSFTTPGDVLSPKEIDAAMKEIAVARGRESPFTLIAHVAVPDAVDRALQAAAANQAKIDQAQIACALERYHLARGSYPETLDALSPQFIEKIPRDPIGGRPFHYRRTADGTFLLYSVGWNGTDDGGKTVPNITGYYPAVEGDWVWNH